MLLAFNVTGSPAALRAAQAHGI